MKYKKLSWVLVLSLVLMLLISLALISTWGYYYFYDRDNGKAKAAPAPEQSAAVADRHDSLQQLYTAAVDHLNAGKPVDSIQNRPGSLHAPDSRLAEFYRLKEEIGLLLKKNTGRDLDSARQKIAMLQQKVEELRSRTVAVEWENKRLGEVVSRLNSQLRSKEAPARYKLAEARTMTGRMETMPEEAFSSLTAADLQLAAGSIPEGEQLSGSFVVRDPARRSGGADLYVVVLQPDGRVLQSSAWETGTFESREGRKIYSTRIRLGEAPGEGKKLAFVLHPEQLQKGNYTLQVYHQGVLIGSMAKFL